MSPSPQAHLFFRVRLSKQKLVYPVKDYPEDGEPVYVIVFSYPGPGGGAGQFSVDRLGSASPLVEEVGLRCHPCLMYSSMPTWIVLRPLYRTHCQFRPFLLSIFTTTCGVPYPLLRSYYVYVEYWCFLWPADGHSMPLNVSIRYVCNLFACLLTDLLVYCVS